MTNSHALACKISARPDAALRATARLLNLGDRAQAALVLTAALDGLRLARRSPRFAAFCAALDAAL